MKPTVIEGIRVYEDKTVRVHEEESLLGDDLWEPSCDDEGNTCVTLGKSHPYFHKMYNVCKDNVEAMKALDMFYGVYLMPNMVSSLKRINIH